MGVTTAVWIWSAKYEEEKKNEVCYHGYLNYKVSIMCLCYQSDIDFLTKYIWPSLL